MDFFELSIFKSPDILSPLLYFKKFPKFILLSIFDAKVVVCISGIAAGLFAVVYIDILPANIAPASATYNLFLLMVIPPDIV